MDKEMLELHLIQAEEHVALGEIHIARQRELIINLEEGSLNIFQAREILASFEEMQIEYVRRRDGFLRELAQKT